MLKHKPSGFDSSPLDRGSRSWPATGNLSRVSTQHRPPVSPLLVLGIGVFAVSTGAVFARLAEAPAFAISFWRCGLAALVFLPLARGKLVAEMKALQSRERMLLALSGLCLSVHFAAWITSLEYTTVAASVLLVNTAPIWVGVISHFSGEGALGGGMRWGIALAFAGSAIVAWGDFGGGDGALFGDGLALLGAMSLSVYLAIGRRLRPHLSLPSYATACYGVAALSLLLLSVGSGTPLTGFDAETWGWLIACALVPQALGHSASNWVLRWSTAPMVAISLLGEPIGAMLLAIALLGEFPPAQALAGTPLILLGIFLGARSENR